MKRIVLASVVLLVAAAPLAHAGWKASGPVLIYPTNRFAQGGMGEARSSPGTQSYLGCKTITYGTTDYLACFAADTAGTYASCYTYDAKLIEAARSLTTASYLFFSWTASGICNEIDVSNISYFAPMVP